MINPEEVMEEPRVWNRIDVALPRHRKTRKLQAALGHADVRLTVGALVGFWADVREQAPDGDLSTWSHEDIALALGEPLDRADRVVEAMLATGWLDGTDTGLVVHEWRDHNGHHLREAARQRDRRAAVNPGPSGGRTEDVRRTYGATDVRTYGRNETNEKNATPPSGGAPGSAGNAPRFASPGRLAPKTTPEPPGSHGAPQGGPTEASGGVRDRSGDVADLVLGVAKARRLPPRISGKLDRDGVAEAIGAQPADVTRTAMQIAQRLFTAGWGQSVVELAAKLYVTERARIRNPFAYFAPGGGWTQSMMLTFGASITEAEHERMKAEDAAWLASLRERKGGTHVGS